MTTTTEPRVAADTLEIIIQQRHIDQGERGSSYYCPVALALRDAGYEHPCVGFKIWTGDSRPWGVTSELSDWVWAFDCGGPVFPERFVLRREG